jgi:sulfopyruvate decarboxylase subunit beta
MIRYECLELLAAKITDQLVVTSQSGQRIEWSHLSRHDGNLLVGMMGCAIGVGMGLALALPHRKVIVLDSDGSVLLSLFNLPTLGNLQPKNLAVYVFDNGVYSGSRISYPTATAGNTDLEAMAKGAGIKNARTLRDLEDFRINGLDALARNELAFCVCKVEESLMHREIPRPNTDLMENKYAFVRYLERTEKKAIPFVGRG